MYLLSIMSLNDVLRRTWNFEIPTLFDFRYGDHITLELEFGEIDCKIMHGTQIRTTVQGKDTQINLGVKTLDGKPMFFPNWLRNILLFIYRRSKREKTYTFNRPQLQDAPLFDHSEKDYQD